MNLLLVLLGALLLVTLAVVLTPLWRSGARKMALLLALALSLAISAIYAHLGSPRLVELADARNVEMQALYEQIRVTSALVKAQPQNLEAWLTLSQAFFDVGDYAAAANGFKQAVLLSKGHPRIIMAYAESLIMQDGGAVGAQAKKSIDIALMIDPKLPLARYYNAVWLLQAGKQQEAMQEMKTLYHELPEDSSLKKRMKEQIGR